MFDNFIYTSTKEFEKDFKALSKRFKNLEYDLEEFKKAALFLYHKLERNNGGFFVISGLHIDDPRYIFIKVKKFICSALKGRGAKSGIRIVYCYDNQEKKISFIEMYFKQNQSECNYKRIKDFYASLK